MFSRQMEPEQWEVDQHTSSRHIHDERRPSTYLFKTKDTEYLLLEPLPFARSPKKEYRSTNSLCEFRDEDWTIRSRKNENIF